MVDFTSDCKNCAALCCMALAFDKGEMFAFDKPAGVPCQHLNGPLCGVHTQLEAEGLTGCVQYQCDGAGQRVVQEVFASQSWQKTPALLHPMLEAFSQMRQVHGLLALLTSAKALPLQGAQQAALEALMAQLSPEAWTPQALAEFERSGVSKTIHRFLRSLRDLLS